MRRSLLSVVLVLLLAQTSNAWWECGHHIITLLAYEQLTPNEQKALYRILKSHPRFEQDFSGPANTSNIVRWQIGHSGYWPDVARKLDEYHRSTWHYQLGSTLSIGSINVPADPGPLPDDATLMTQELHVGQAIVLCQRVLADRSRTPADRALAMCWLAHCIGDIHQPCHAGSIYVDGVFPDGDRGGNRIGTVQRKNLHGLWDSLLGETFDEGDIARRMKEIKSDTKNWEAAISAAQDLNPIHWVSESRDIAKAATYTDEVLNPIKAARRSGTDKVETISLSDDYLKVAGKIAQQRVAVAAHRLAAVWRMCLTADSSAVEKDANKKVRVWFCPSKEPSRVIADELTSANSTIDVAIYSFSDKAIRKVLVEAANRGVTIRLILNQANKHKSLADALEDAGIDVRYVSQTMHHKFCVVDGRVLLTGSMNWSPQSYVRYDEDLVKFQKSPEVISAFQSEFEYIWLNSKEYGQEIHGAKSVPLRRKVADVHFTSANMTPSQYRGLPTFTESDALEDGVCGRRLIQSIGNARKLILVATTHFRRSDIAYALRNALARGVRVELVLDMQEYHKPDTEMTQSRFDERLAEIGANVKYKVYAKEWAYQTALQMHTKFAIIDGTEVLTGSFNYSRNSELNSFENLVSIRDPHAVVAYTKRFRMIQRYGRGQLPTIIEQINTSSGAEPRRFAPITMDSTQIFRLRSAYKTANDSD